MIRFIATSLRHKLMAVILATTAVTLALTACAMLLFEIYAYRTSWANDLVAQAEIIGLASAPAIAFNDPAAARENLGLLRLRPNILSGAIYAADGTPFAVYTQPGLSNVSIPATPGMPGHTIRGDEITVFHPIRENRELVGTVYLHARFDLAERVESYVIILGLSMLGSMLIALLIAARLQRALTQPIFDVTEVAKRVIASRDFSLRVNKTTGDEIGVLVDAFNDMLREVGLRAEALENTNRTLAQEMEVRRSAEAKLLLADRRKDEFLAMLAHELRNPLAPISAAAQILKLGRLDEERTRQTSDLIARQVDHMTSLVNDLLDVSRVTRGLIVLDKQTQDLKRIATDAVEQVRPLMVLRQHALELQLPSEPVFVIGDEKRLVQVIANLLNNAAKYTPVGGQVWLRLEQRGEEAVLTVRDNGIGMDADLRANVFELFTQAHRSSDRSLGGLGLGLALVKNIVELHGGSVAAHSEGDGKGSEFVVCLPRAPVAAAPAQHRQDRLEARPGGSRLRVMVVDDNRDAADTLAGYLEISGYEVQVEYGPEAALERARELRPQVCLLDIGLPGMDGHALARALRQVPGMADAVLIAVTGYGQKQDRDNARAAGFDHHLVKPVDAPALAVLLADIGARHQIGASGGG